MTTSPTCAATASFPAVGGDVDIAQGVYGQVGNLDMVALDTVSGF